MKAPGLFRIGVCFVAIVSAQSDRPVYHSPIALVADSTGSRIYAIDATGSQVVELDTSNGRSTRTIPLPGTPSGAVLNKAANRLYVTADNPSDSVFIIDLTDSRLESTLPAGHGPTAPVLSFDESTLYVCNRYDNTVSVIDLRERRAIKQISVIREPIAAALSPDGKLLLVGNQKPDGPATAPSVSSAVSLIDVKENSVSSTIRLPNGGVGIRGIAISPDSRYAFVSHVLGRNHVPATQLEQGWLNTNAISVIDLESRNRLSTILLDRVERGAGNPWGVALTPDGRRLCVVLAGVHQLAVVELPQLFEKLQKLGDRQAGGESQADEYHPLGRPDTDLTFLEGYSLRIPLKGAGPRALVVRGERVYVGMYFSGTVETVNLENPKTESTVLALGAQPAETDARRGERLFNDASLSFQGWQSCSTCHPDGRSDGLNWDLTNDGVGTTKNTKSLLFAWATPPLTWTGVFPSLNECVPHELETILFASRPKEDATAIAAYLKSLQEIPSPYLEEGNKLSAAAQRGQMSFTKAGCIACHKGEYTTAMQMRNVGTSTLGDRTRTFDIPSLREVWRTAPYLHDGRAPSIKDIFLKFDQPNMHGKHSVLTPKELDDLVQYVLSL
jgi:YVTN family beta-propeller protein